jgi:hypothetical protein
VDELPRKNNGAIAQKLQSERFPFEWNRERFHSNGKAREGDADCTGHIQFG